MVVVLGAHREARGARLGIRGEDGPGRAEVKLKLVVDAYEVSLSIPGAYKLSGETRQALRKLPGIVSVQDL